MNNLNDNMAQTYDKENRGVPRLIARHIITLVPPINRESVVHDNACGPAIVTSEMLSTVPSNITPLRIEATDISAPMIEAASDVIKSNDWGFVNTSVMDSQKLSFENDTFSHSITNLLIPSAPPAVSEIYRTLKPGGTAVYTVWKSHGFLDLMRRSGGAIRGNNGPTGMAPQPTAESLKAMFELAGFGGGEIVVQTHNDALPFKGLDDLNDLAVGPFGKFLTKDWSAEEVGRLPETIGKVLTAEELNTMSLEMVVWVIIAKKL